MEIVPVSNEQKSPLLIFFTHSRSNFPQIEQTLRSSDSLVFFLQPPQAFWWLFFGEKPDSCSRFCFLILVLVYCSSAVFVGSAQLKVALVLVCSAPRSRAGSAPRSRACRAVFCCPNKHCSAVLTFWCEKA
ncbi:hypothetical protein CDL15_Pgr004320 [Punica granatum]|uniref:Uncharacterized protein n=1 Tax=Punica granatum TaxID=22663 RepID=A0A218XGT2_PUNGR|nr:hypothetical protein CDL15_Pgr004320 [Punica granatum]